MGDWLSDEPPLLDFFALYGKRFGGIGPHFQGITMQRWLLHSHLRDAQALRCLFMLLYVGCYANRSPRDATGDWTAEWNWRNSRGLSFLPSSVCRAGFAIKDVPALKALPR